MKRQWCTSLRLVLLGLAGWAIGLAFYAGGAASQAVLPQHSPASDLRWIEAGEAGTLPAELYFDNPDGRLGFLNTSGPLERSGHPFFEPTGMNPRGCVTCHQPSQAMSVSVKALQDRWRLTQGEDPIFAPVDGSDNPTLPQARASSHSLLLKRGVFRIGLVWPPKDNTGRTIKPEFTLEVAYDPTGVNQNATYGLKSGNPTVSVFRRPRPVANLKYLLMTDTTDAGGDSLPELSLMADARHSTLKAQAFAAYKDHQEGRNGLSAEQLQQIAAFETQVYVAQSHDQWGGSLIEPDGQTGLGPQALAQRKLERQSKSQLDPVFHFFDGWKDAPGLPAELTAAQRAFRLSVARGSAIFRSRQFWIREVAHLTSAEPEPSRKGSCTTCHTTSMKQTGVSRWPHWMDAGTVNFPREKAFSEISAQTELPVFKCICDETAPPHPYLGRVIYTTDPGRALLTGKCGDIGALVPGQLRGLAARAPYFTNGSAQTLRAVVDWHDRRFAIHLSEQEKQDLVNFLSVL